MKTSDEFVASLRGLDRAVYLPGERLGDPPAHPLLHPSFNSLAETYPSRPGSPKPSVLLVLK